MQVNDFLQPVTDLLAGSCSCSLDQSALHNSTLSCSYGGLQFEAELLYSSDDGSVTASTAIALMEYHLAEQSNPVLTVDGEDLPIITSTSSCPLAQLIGMFLGGVGVTFLFCTLIAVAFWYIHVCIYCLCHYLAIQLHVPIATTYSSSVYSIFVQCRNRSCLCLKKLPLA